LRDFTVAEMLEGSLDTFKMATKTPEGVVVGSTVALSWWGFQEYTKSFTSWLSYVSRGVAETDADINSLQSGEVAFAPIASIGVTITVIS